MASKAALELVVTLRDEASKGMDQLANKALSFKNITKTLGAIGIGFGVAEITRAALELGNMGEQSEQLERKSIALAGGLNQARAAQRAMTDAVGQALTQDDALRISTELMSKGLAASGEEAGRLAKMALALGDSSLTGAERIDAFSRALQTGRVQGLIPFGFNIEQLKARQDELQESNEGMSTSAALAAAALEQGARRMEAFAAAGGIATTSAQDMAVATEDLKDTLASLVAKPYTVTIKYITEGISDLNKNIQNPARAAAMANEQLLLTRLANQERLQNAYNEAVANSDPILALMIGQLMEVNGGMISQAQAAVEASKAQAQYNDDILRGASNLQGYQRAMTDVAQAYYAVNTARILSGSLGTTGSLNPRVPEGTFTTTGAMMSQMAPDEGTRDMIQGHIDTAINAKKAAEQLSNLEKAAGGATSAFEKQTASIESKLGEASGMMGGLLKGTGLDMNADWVNDPNGPFRDLRRLADVAKQGEKSPWAAGLGVSQEDAKRITGDAIRGLWTDEVKKFVNVELAAKDVGLDKQAEKLTRSFAEEIGLAVDQRDLKQQLQDSGATAFRVIKAGFDAAMKTTPNGNTTPPPNPLQAEAAKAGLSL